jgi:hypothetical protein
MMNGPKQPSGGPFGGRGKSRRRRPQGKNGPQQRPGGQGAHSRNNPGGIYSAPMDHNYRSALNGQKGGPAKGRPQRGRPGMAAGTQYLQPEPDPLPLTENPETRIFAFVDDLFFSTKIKETARKLNVPVEFVKTDKEVMEKVGADGNNRSALAIFDLNNAAIKPLSLITKLKSKMKKKLNIIAFVSHVQGDLKVKAQEAGCDMVMPRSAFSQNLPQLLRRHGAPDDSAASA